MQVRDMIRGSTQLQKHSKLCTGSPAHILAGQGNSVSPCLLGHFAALARCIIYVCFVSAVAGPESSTDGSNWQAGMRHSPILDLFIMREWFGRIRSTLNDWIEHLPVSFKSRRRRGRH